MTEGFLLVDKPRGPTSHDVVDAVRRAVGVRRVGHAGTLDPMATGLVVVAIGRATRLVRFVQDLPKEYEAIARFGVATTTLDAEGEVIHQEEVRIGAGEVREAAGGLVGRIGQVPPMVSALKVGGRRLYEIAREGGEIEREPRPVDIYELEVGEVGEGPHPDVHLRVRCGKGTYVRVLADDLAVRLGTRAHLTSLRRTRIGSLSVSAAVPMGELDGGVALLEPGAALVDLPDLPLTAEHLEGVRHGRAVPVGLAEAPAGGVPVRVLDPAGRLLAIYRATDLRATAEVVLA